MGSGYMTTVPQQDTGGPVIPMPDIVADTTIDMSSACLTNPNDLPTPDSDFVLEHSGDNQTETSTDQVADYEDPTGCQLNRDEPNVCEPKRDQPCGHQPNGYEPSEHQPNGCEPSEHQPHGREPSEHQPHWHEQHACEPSEHPNGHEPNGQQPHGHEPNGHQPNEPGMNNVSTCQDVIPVFPEPDGSATEHARVNSTIPGFEGSSIQDETSPAGFDEDAEDYEKYLILHPYEYLPPQQLPRAPSSLENASSL